ncbi:MAG: LamG domain-containing protein [Chloroflexi bacterium]|nr:LamG domain-containing protein [Chloroflexota bacterium]
MRNGRRQRGRNHSVAHVLQAFFLSFIVFGLMIVVSRSIDSAGASDLAPFAAAGPSSSAPQWLPTGSPTPTTTPRARSPKNASEPAIPGQTQSDQYTVALYHFDSQTGNVIQDDSGNHHDGTLYNGAAVTNVGLYGGALQLNGNPAYFSTGYLGNLPMGTIEAFIDFRDTCYATDSYLTIFAAGGELGGQPAVMAMTIAPGLYFGIYVNGQWQWASSGINPCRYFTGGDQYTNFNNWGLTVNWPYETWRFHQVAGTWGPRGVEIWTDGVLHGVTVPDLDKTPPPYGFSDSYYSCNPQRQVSSPLYPVCSTPVFGPAQQDSYTGGLPAYQTFTIGCDPDPSKICFKGRLDELRISNIQRRFTAAVDPTSTPPPSPTPISIAHEYSVDPPAMALYHMNSTDPWNRTTDAVTGKLTGLGTNTHVVPNGRFGGADAVTSKSGPTELSNLSVPDEGTFETWVNLSAVGNNFVILGAKEYSNSGEDVYLGVENEYGRNIRFGIYDTSGLWHWVDSGIDPSTMVGSWHHVAGTWGLRGLEIWVDGELCSSDPTYRKPPTNPVYAYLVGCGSLGLCTQGMLDEVRLSNVARSFLPAALTGPASASPSRLVRAPRSVFELFFPIVSVSPPDPYLHCGGLH